MSRLLDTLFLLGLLALLALMAYRTNIVLGPDACWTSC
jgi:hypothetical protein